jgi:hypothetical protein
MRKPSLFGGKSAESTSDEGRQTDPGKSEPKDQKNVTAGAPITGRRYPACRLVLPPTAAVDLINRMMQIATALRQAGVVKPSPEPVGAPQPR